MNNQVPEIFTVIPITHYLLLGTILFVVGMIGVMVRKNVIIVFMCIEIMLNAVNLMLTSTSAYFSNCPAIIKSSKGPNLNSCVLESTVDNKDLESSVTKII